MTVFVAFGWKAGLLAIALAFVYGALGRPVAARVAARLMSLRYRDDGRQPSAASPAVQKAFAKQIRLLLANLQRPSLRAKKYDEARDIWQARVTRNWRFYFTFEGDTVQLLDIVAHPK